MFGLFKPKLAPEGPVEFTFDVEINKSAEEMYALVDWEDPRNAKRATGCEVSQVQGTDDQYLLVIPSMPDLTFRFLVTAAEPARKYAFGCVIEPQFGNLAHNHETYEIEPLSENSCRLTLVTETTFVDGLREKDFVREIAAMTASVQSSLQKLKIQAEHGADVAKALEENTVL